MTNTLRLTPENLRAKETLDRLDDPDVEPVCGACGAAVEVVRASTATDAAGKCPPVLLLRCTRAERHLYATFTPRVKQG